MSNQPDPMTRKGSLEDIFIATVMEMRAAQKAFFSTRGSDEHTQALRDSKRLEREVDAMIKQMRPPAETGLFQE